MPICKVWDIVKVPFPYSDRPVRERRPALVIVADPLQAQHDLIWVLMITSAANRGWPSDVAISDLAMTGLRADSVVRTAKLAVIDGRDAEIMGQLPADDRIKVSTALTDHLGAVLRNDPAP